MPITKSAAKASAQSLVRRARRQPYKTRMKTLMRTVVDLVKEGKKDDAAKAVPAAYKAIDMAAKRNLIHWKNAARKKSNMAKMVGKK